MADGGFEVGPLGNVHATVTGKFPRKGGFGFQSGSEDFHGTFFWAAFRALFRTSAQQILAQEAVATDDEDFHEADGAFRTAAVFIDAPAWTASVLRATGLILSDI